MCSKAMAKYWPEANGGIAKAEAPSSGSQSVAEEPRAEDGGCVEEVDDPRAASMMKMLNGELGRADFESKNEFLA